MARKKNKIPSSNIFNFGGINKDLGLDSKSCTANFSVSIKQNKAIKKEANLLNTTKSQLLYKKLEDYLNLLVERHNT